MQRYKEAENFFGFTYNTYMARAVNVIARMHDVIDSDAYTETHLNA